MDITVLQKAEQELREQSQTSAVAADAIRKTIFLVSGEKKNRLSPAGREAIVNARLARAERERAAAGKRKGPKQMTGHRGRRQVA